MKQMTFADAEYAGKRKQTRKESFPIEMDQVVPWKGLVTLIEPHYPKGEGGRPAYPLMAMLRVHLMQQVAWIGPSDTQDNRDDGFLVALPILQSLICALRTLGDRPG
jgi:IS5 family transposase